MTDPTDDTVTIPRELAERIYSDMAFGAAANELAAILDPESVVTDEMVEAVQVCRAGGWDWDVRPILEAAVECGWMPPQELSQEGGPTASSSEAVAPGSQAGGEAGVPQGPCPESESLSPPPPSLAVVGADDYWRRRYVDVRDEWDEALNRLSMAEGLLRKATYRGVYEPDCTVNGLYWEWSIGRSGASTYVEVSEAEAECLRSLEGE